jgi:hypothetical protein
VLERGLADASAIERCAIAFPVLEATRVREGRDDEQAGVDSLRHHGTASQWRGFGASQSLFGLRGSEGSGIPKPF